MRMIFFSPGIPAKNLYFFQFYRNRIPIIFLVFVLHEAFMKYPRNHGIHITKVSQDPRFMKQHSATFTSSLV